MEQVEQNLPVEDQAALEPDIGQPDIQGDAGSLDAPTKQVPDSAGTPDEMLSDEQAADILNEETTEEATEEASDESATEESVISVAKEIYPDREFATEQEAIQAVREYTESSKEYEKRTKEANQSLVNIFNNNQELVALVRMLNSGASFVEALPHVVDVDALLPKEGDPDWEAWQKAKEEGTKTRADREAKKKEIANNLEMSMAEVDKFAQENEMTPEEAGEFLTTIDTILENVSQGNITRDILEKFKKGLFHDKIVKEESEKAEIRGRNEAIEEKVEKKSKNKGDGLPEVKSASTEEEAPEQPSDPASTLGSSISDYVNQRRRF